MTSIYNKLVGFFAARNMFFWVFIVLVLGVFAYSTYLVATYTIVTITVTYHDDINEKALLYSIRQNNSDFDDELRPITGDTYVMRKDTIALRASTDNYSTIKEEVSTALGSKNTINLYRDKNAVKYSGDNPGCMTYSAVSDTLLSYSCTQPRELVSYGRNNQNGFFKNTSVATIVSGDMRSYSIQPYQGGVVGVRIPRFAGTVPTSNFIYYIDSKGEVTETNVPDTVEQNQLGGMSVVTDTTSLSSSNFLLISKQSSTIYFANGITKAPTTYKEYQLPEDFSSTFNTVLCSLVESKAYCFYGFGSGAPDSERETEHQEENTLSKFLVIDFSSETPSAKEYTATTPTTIDSVHVTQSGNVYSLSGTTLLAVTLQEDKAQIDTISTEVNSVTSGDGLFFVRDNKVYKLDDTTNESYAVFHSPKLRIGNLVSINENIFINAYVDGMVGQRIHTYKLTNDSNTTPGMRFIDRLPLDSNASNDISDMDLYKNELHIRLKVAVSKTGRSGISSTAYDQAKQRVLDLLQEESIDTSSMNITFSY